MAKKQKIDQSQIDLSSIGQLLSNIAAESLQDAIDTVEFSSVSYNLADAIVGGLQDVDVAKIIKENLVDDTAVKKVLTDAQKKVEDAIGNMKIQLNNITVPKSPISIDAKLGKVDTSNIVKSISIPVEYSYSDFDLPSESLSVAVDYLYDTFKLPVKEAEKKIQVPVNYIYSKFTLPSIKKIDVPVSYVYDKYTQPKATKINVPVEYDYEKFSLPKISTLDIPVEYTYDKLIQPKAQQIDVPVKYKYDKFVLPTAKPIDIFVDYVYSKLDLPKVSPINVQVKYAYDKFILPKVEAIKVGIEYVYDKLILPKVNTLSVKVGYVYDKFIQPIIKPIVVGVKYAYEKFVLPKAQQVSVAVDYVYSKFNLPKASISVPVSFNYDKFVLPKVGGLSVPVAFDYDEYTQPEPEDITIPVSYDYDKLILPKSQAVNVFVDYVYSKFTLPKANPLSVAVKYVYDKLVLPTVKDIKVPVRYVLDKFVAPKLEPITAKIIPDVSAIGSMDDVNVTAKVSAFNTDLIQQRISEITPIDINTTASGSPVIQTLTSGVEGASDAARSFVNLIGEANKRATITVDLYNRIREAAEKLVSANIMERAEVDKTLQTLESKLKATKSVTLSTKLGKIDTGGIKPLDIEAIVSKVDMSSVDKEVYKYTPIILDAIVNVDTSEIEKLQTNVQPQMQANVTVGTVDTSNLSNIQPVEVDANINPVSNIGGSNTAIREASKSYEEINHLVNNLIKSGKVSEAQGKAILAGMQARVKAAKAEYEQSTNIVENYHDMLKEVSELRKINAQQATNLNDSYAIVEKRTQLQKELTRLSKNELKDLAQKLGLDNIEKLNQEGLISGIENKIIGLQKQKDLQEDLNLAVNDYQQALKQSKADLLIKQATVQLQLTEQETSELAYQMMLENERLTGNRMLTEENKQQLLLKDKQLKHAREEVELIEHVAEYQREVTKEVDELTGKWTKYKATLKAIADSPAFAKGVLMTSAIALGEKLSHSMHEFKEVGMDAGTAVAATLQSLSIKSIMGLSDTSGVLKTIAQQYGTINALTGDQVDAVGTMAKGNGLAAEEATNMVMAMSRMPGMSRESASNSEAMFKSIAKTKGVIPAQVMKEVAKNSGLMATYSKGGAEGFIRAAASAKKMGVELSTMLSAARKTLDFESSIQAEMEASALLGRSMNMDALRRATLAGDAEAIQREQVKLIQQAGGLDNMNLLQKEKLAEMMGMTVEDMQKINDSAKYQEEHFGEQAGIWANITGLLGNGVKYTEGMLTGFAQIAPAITGISSIMSILNVKSFPGMLSSVWSMVRGFAAGVVQAGFLLAKVIALGAVKLFGGKESVEKVKQFFSKDGKAGQLVEKIKGKKPEMPGGADKVAEAGDSASKASDKTKAVKSGTGVKDFLTNLATGLKAMGDGKVLFGAFNLIPASIGLIAMIPGAVGAAIIQTIINGKKLKDSLVGLAKGLEEFGSGKITGGAANLIAASVGLIAMIPGAVGAFLIQSLVDGKKISKSMEGLAQGLTSMGDKGVSGGAFNLLLASGAFVLMTVGIIGLAGIALFGSAAGAGLKGLASGLKAMGNGQVALGASLLMAGAGIMFAAEGMAKLAEQFKQMSPDQIFATAGAFIAFGVAVGIMLNAAAAGSAGVLPLLAVSVVILALAKALEIAQPAVDGISKSLQELASNVSGSEMIKLGFGLGIFTAAVVAMGALSPLIFLASGALAIFGYAMIPLADGLRLAAPALESVGLSLSNLVSNVDGGALIKMGIGAGALGIGIGILGAAAFTASPGLLILSLAMMGISLSMKTIAESINLSSVGIKGLITNLTQLTPLVSGLLKIAGALDKVASSMTKLAIAGILAMPAMAMLKGLGGEEVKPKQPVATSETKAAPAVKAAQPAQAAMTPAPAPAAATTAPTAPTQQSTTTSSGDSSKEISILVNKLTELIGVLKAGGTINVDGRKLANIVQSNIRALKFTD